jgi:hypothetical protein
MRVSLSPLAGVEDDRSLRVPVKENQIFSTNLVELRDPGRFLGIS